jgi:hypothetical protein
MADSDNLVPSGGGEPHAQRARPLPCMKCGAATAGAVRVDQCADFAGNAGLFERIDDELALPIAIGVRLPVLDRAAAAGAEILAERRDALRARSDDFDEVAPVRGSAGRNVRIDDFAAQRVGDVDIPAAVEGNAVAELADMVDGEAFQ